MDVLGSTVLDVDISPSHKEQPEVMLVALCDPCQMASSPILYILASSHNTH